MRAVGWRERGFSRRTGNHNTRVQVDLGTVAQQEGDGAFGRRRPAQGRGHADAHGEAAGRDVEGVLAAGEPGGEGAGQKSECEAHLDDYRVGDSG